MHAGNQIKNWDGADMCSVCIAFTENGCSLSWNHTVWLHQKMLLSLLAACTKEHLSHVLHQHFMYRWSLQSFALCHCPFPLHLHNAVCIFLRKCLQPVANHDFSEVGNQQQDFLSFRMETFGSLLHDTLKSGFRQPFVCIIVFNL